MKPLPSNLTKAFLIIKHDFNHSLRLISIVTLMHLIIKSKKLHNHGTYEQIKNQSLHFWQ